MPLGTFEELSEITKIPKSSLYDIARRLEKLVTVSAQLNLDRLGLEVIDVFLKANKAKKVSYLEKIGQTHPYVSYYARIYGTYSGIYMQFRIPLGTISLIKYFFQMLKNEDHIEEFTILHLGNEISYSTVNVKAWDIESLTWKFSWKDWFDIPVKNPSRKTLQIGSKEKIIPSSGIEGKNSLTWLQSKDIWTISLIFANARRKNIEIKEELLKKNWKVNDSTLSRRLKHIKKEYISGYRVQVDTHLFDVVNTVLIWGQGSEEELIKIRQRFETSKIPFISTLKISNYTLYWYIHLPTFHLSELLYQLRLILDEIYFFYVDYPRAQLYSLDSDAWDETTHAWKQSEDYFCNDVKRIVDAE